MVVFVEGMVLHFPCAVRWLINDAQRDIARETMKIHLRIEESPLAAQSAIEFEAQGMDASWGAVCGVECYEVRSQGQPIAMRVKDVWFVVRPPLDRKTLRHMEILLTGGWLKKASFCDGSSMSLSDPESPVWRALLNNLHIVDLLDLRRGVAGERMALCAKGPEAGSARLSTIMSKIDHEIDYRLATTTHRRRLATT